MKITLSKQQWEFIGKKTGWIKTAKTTSTYKDKNNSGKTITISGSDTIDPNMMYQAEIRDEFGTIESVFEGTLGEIYSEAKKRNFVMPESIKELQTTKIAKNNVIKTAQGRPDRNYEETHTTTGRKYNVYYYHINLDERGEFYADVRKNDKETVFEIKGFDIFEDGFIKHKKDMNGLKDYLIHLKIMNMGDELKYVG